MSKKTKISLKWSEMLQKTEKWFFRIFDVFNIVKWHRCGKTVGIPGLTARKTTEIANLRQKVFHNFNIFDCGNLIFKKQF